MIVTEPLEQILTAKGVRELGIEDRELDEILSLTSQNRYLPAAERAQKLWQQQIYDVRTVGCYLFGVFVERGVASLSLLFECIRRALSDNLAYLSPSHKKERHLDVSLRWLFDSIVSQVRFHERQKDELWTKWNHDWQHAAQEQALEHCNKLLETLDLVIPGSRSKQPLLHLQSLLQGLARAPDANAGWHLEGATQIPAPPPPPGEEEESSGQDEDSSSDDEDSSSDDDDSSSSDEDSSSDDEDSDSDDEVTSSTASEEEDEDSNAASREEDEGSEKEEEASKGTSDDDDTDNDDEPDKERAAEGDEERSDREGAHSEEEEEVQSEQDEPSPASSSSARAVGRDSLSTGVAEAQTLGTADTLTIPLCGELKLLLTELAGFVRLVHKQRYRRAAILQLHIAKKLEGFEPSRYFPSLLMDYLLALIQHSSKLTPHLQPAEDLETAMLKLLCRSDISRFVADSEQ